MRKFQPVCDDAFRAALAASVRGSDETRFIHRLHVVLLVSLGHSCYEVAQRVAADPRSVERWVRAYQRQGADVLHDHHGGGRPGRLTAAQLRQLGDDLARPPAALGYAQTGWSGKLVAMHLQRSQQLQISLRQCQRLLGRLGPLRH